MQKIFAIFLLLCIVSLQFGYHAIYFSKKVKVERDWFEQIYGDNEPPLPEMTLRIPLSVAYMPDQEAFTESNSSFEKDGQHYRIIKQRYKQDTLEIVYVPDAGKTQLRNMAVAWAKSISSGQAEGAKGLSAVKAPLPDYDQNEQRMLSVYFIPEGSKSRPVTIHADFQENNLLPSSPPPERV